MNSDLEKFFTDYEDLEVHELMLKDRSRQEAYFKAITNNTKLFRNKIVLDVGAGTGVLSAFCAKAGAKLVYAVEASKLAIIALEVMEENNLTSAVKVIHSKIEEFSLPISAEKVDIIVSEWMGFYLLHEGMLDSLIYARDTFLKPGGQIFPQEATIYIAPCTLPNYFSYWDEVDGVRMSRFAKYLRKQKLKKPQITKVNEENLLHEGTVMYWVNLQDVTCEDVNEISFKEVISIQKAGKHQGFCIWFECRFPSESLEGAVILSTSPQSPDTHWQQCVIGLPDTACEDLEENAPIAFHISMKKNLNDRRKYNIELKLLDPNTTEHHLPCDCYLTKCILTKAHLSRIDLEN